MKNLMLRTTPALLLAIVSGAASASAFQLWEQNASGLGNAYVAIDVTGGKREVPAENRVEV